MSSSNGVSPAGDTPFEDDIINGKNGEPYSGQDVVGIYPIKKGFALVERVEGTYFQQGFRERNGNSKPYGKMRKVKNIDNIERKTGRFFVQYCRYF